MGNKSDFFSAVHPELQEPLRDFTKMLIGAAQIPGVSRMNHSVRNDFDSQRPLPGLSRSR